MGESATALLRKALDDKQSLEVRRRLEDLLAHGPKPLPTGEALRQMRALEVLEMIGTPEARQVLGALARGAPGARMTQEASAALERLARQTAKSRAGR